MTAPRYLAPCAVCRGEVPHEAIASVQSGLAFFRCLNCGTVTHTPKTINEEPRP